VPVVPALVLPAVPPVAVTSNPAR